MIDFEYDKRMKISLILSLPRSLSLSLVAHLCRKKIPIALLLQLLLVVLSNNHCTQVPTDQHFRFVVHGIDVLRDIMPNNCSALIQRKQNILHKVLRSNSEGKLQNATSETTAELSVGGIRKPSTFSSSAGRLTTNGSATARRSNYFSTNRVQPSLESVPEKHLPSIREISGQQQALPTDVTRPKTPARPPSASASSIMNIFAKRSAENIMSINGDADETIHSSPVPPPSRRSRRPSNGNTKHLVTVSNSTPPRQIPASFKQSGDSGVDIHFSPNSPDHHQNIYRPTALTLKNRTHMAMDSAYIPETHIRERTNQLYQRRPNYNVKAPIKQKIDKYRRRSEETVHATQTNNLIHVTQAGLTATAPALVTPPSHRSRNHIPASPKPVRRVTSDAEVRARLDVVRLSMDTTLNRPDDVHQRMKSPYLYTTHQQLAPPTTAQTSSAVIRPSHSTSQRILSSNAPQSHRRQQQQPTTNKPSSNNNQTNLYLAFIASRHLSTLEGTLVECDIDHPKLLRIFTWLKNVEDTRHEQQSHDQLLIEQNQRMLEQEDNLSLYSEIEYAVDDIQPNTTGKSYFIPTMNFEK